MQQTPIEQQNGQKLQSVISDDLFPQVAHISDVKQVIEEMEAKAQSLREPQLQGLILLKKLGENEYLHGNKNPYMDLYKELLSKYKIAVASPDYYLDTIEALIPKPPKPIVLAEKAGKR